MPDVNSAAAENPTLGAGATSQPAPKQSILGRRIAWLVFLAMVVAALAYTFHWWTVSRFLQSTNDAYLAADDVAAAPRVSGYVTEVLVRDNQWVRAGQPLVRIDPVNYRAVLAQDRATADARQADIVAAQAQIQQQLSQVEEAKAKLAGSEQNARYAAQLAGRYRGLSSSGAESAQELSQAVNNSDQAEATARIDAAALAAAERQTETLKAQLGQAYAQAEAAQATETGAALDVDNTLIRASITGRVGDRTVQVGQFVTPGSRLLSIVPVQDIYVVANFKETQIDAMQAGQSARISVDALDGRVLHGMVDSFAPGTGSQFALLPPENATGNFIKIVQRVPVRFRIETDDATKARLLPGLSVTVEVDTRGASTQGDH